MAIPLLPPMARGVRGIAKTKEMSASNKLLSKTDDLVGQITQVKKEKDIVLLQEALSEFDFSDAKNVTFDMLETSATERIKALDAIKQRA